MQEYLKFYKREKINKKVVEIDYTLYEKLQYLSNEIYDANINQLICACINVYYSHVEENNNLYIAEKNKTDITVMRTVSFRESEYKKLEFLKGKYSVSIYRLLNSAIKYVLDKSEILIE